MADQRMIQFNGQLFGMDNQGNIRTLMARKKKGGSRAFTYKGDTYYLDADRRLWRFFSDAITALGAQGDGKLDMPEGVSAQPGKLDQRSGLWCRLTRDADREIMLDFIVSFHSMEG